MPNLFNFLSDIVPTPGIFLMFNLGMNASMSFGVITNWPFGLLISLAILARNLLGAIPAEAVTPTSE